MRWDIAGKLAERMYVVAATGQLAISELALYIGEVRIVSVSEYVQGRWLEENLGRVVANGEISDDD